ncbi:DUF262 domain-containing protein [Corynebacterium qintianiae]|uniref:DUF262 domain-containing protein n=1 Tax=Corynebacterium qintianiae TaxID=2709392 RepID=A0A7T0KNN2_9CORY|nr:DUF262 domain-containing protein [Corynebacterium qintianiae]QPK84066.1 DUF262 domain-containing protein [Corynebacterium qintianiae]
MSFTTPSYSLTDLFARAHRGELQLPDFQREYIWDVDRVRTLVTSVLRGYPIGSLLALDTRNAPVRFKSRPLAGAPETQEDPGLLLLDGQQRLTSLYHALRGGGVVPTVDFLGNRIERRFFVDIRRAASADPMPVESVFAVDVDGRVRSHFGPNLTEGIRTRDDMLIHGVIPVSDLLGAEGNALLFDLAASTGDPALREAATIFQVRVMNQLPAYDVPVVRIDRGTSLIGIGQIFAHANSAGVQMDVFELLTALFALQEPGFVLAEHWAGVDKQLREHPALDNIGRIEFLRAMSLLVTGRRGPARGHRGDILSLTLVEYLGHADEMAAGFAAAAEFLAERRMLDTSQVPYTAQVIPLAVVLARLAERPGVLEGDQARDRLNRWFWSGVFGELYGAHSPMIRAGADVDEVTPWVAGETEMVPRTVEDARCTRARIAAAGPDSGVFRALFALLMARGARDWRTGAQFNRETMGELQPVFEQVFPAAVCAARGVDKALAESAVNRTPMGIRTRILIENNVPKRYIPRLQSKSLMEDSEFDAMLTAHEIDVAHLLASDIGTFMGERLHRLSALVEHAMGKQVDAS